MSLAHTPFKIISRSLIAGSFVYLSACGGSGGGSDDSSVGSNGLLPEAQGCSFLLDAPFDLSASDLNEFGCAYTDDNGVTQVWAGTAGTFSPGATDPDPEDNNTGTSNIVAAPVDNSIDTTDDTPVQTVSGLSFPEVQAFGAELLDNGSTDLYAGAPNTALLSGPVIGDGTEQNSDLFRSVPYLAVNFPPEFEILHALVHDWGVSRGTASLTMHLRNKSNEMQCFVSHGVIEAFNSDGNVIATGLLDFGFADGTIAATSTGLITDTCVAPNQIVYLTNLLSQDVTLDQVAGVRVQDLTFSSGEAVAVEVRPVSYEVNNGNIDVLIANRSTATVSLDSSVIFVLTDAGIPVYNNLDLHRDTVLLPGEEVVLSYRDWFAGNATNIRVLLDYDVEEE